MGAAVFVGLVLLVLVVLGFALYGAFLGLLTMVAHIRRLWLRLTGADEDSATPVTTVG